MSRPRRCSVVGDVWVSDWWAGGCRSYRRYRLPIEPRAMPAYDPAFTAASCFILRPGASGRLLWVFTLFLWLDYIILPSGSKVNISCSQSGQKIYLIFWVFCIPPGGDLVTISERMFSLLDERGLSASGLCKVLGVGTNQTTNWKQRNTCLLYTSDAADEL